MNDSKKKQSIDKFVNVHANDDKQDKYPSTPLNRKSSKTYKRSDSKRISLGPSKKIVMGEYETP